MQRLFDAGLEAVVLWLAVLAVLIAAAIYVIGRIRAKAVQQELTTSELLSKFRESYYQGELTDAEFRTIKTTLASQLRDELSNNDQTA
jgi:uncharacterized membrane protein